MADRIQCKQSLAAEQQVCHHCSAPQNSLNNYSSEIKTGSGNQNVNVGGNAINANIHIGDSHHQNVYGTQNLMPSVGLVNANQTWIKAVWFSLLGWLGLVGSIACISGYSLKSLFTDSTESLFPTWMLLVGFISVMMLIWTDMLLKGGGLILMNPLFDKVLTVNAAGFITTNDVSGTCPVPSCNGELRVRVTRNGNKNEHMLVCSRFYRHHHFPFYPGEIK